MFTGAYFISEDSFNSKIFLTLFMFDRAAVKTTVFTLHTAHFLNVLFSYAVSIHFVNGSINLCLGR